MKNENQFLLSALAAFPYEGKIVALEPFGSGHINDTYAVYLKAYPEPRIGYILQRLNTNVFKKPKEVMQNIMGVTEYIHQYMLDNDQDPSRGVLRFLRTNQGEHAYFDQEGMPWRSYRFVEHSHCHEKAPTPETFYQSGRAFGEFLQILGDYPADTLHETIPDFHHTPKRLDDLERAVAADPLGRVSECAEEIEFVRQRADDCAMLINMLEAGELPLRVTHNDTKLNNVLFDSQTGKAICVIDLDTIMPGLALHDFGDSIRFGASTAVEDERDLSKVKLSLPLFEAYTKGYLEKAGDVLTENEIRMLPEGARIITLECGIRFLTDHILGDTYFKTELPGQNLDRSRTQFKLVREMEREMKRLHQIVAQHAGPAKE